MNTQKKRDWQEDFELCETASPGPWKDCGASCGLIWCVSTDAVVATTNTYDKEVSQSMKKCIIADAHFIAEARQALPYWLLKVKELEEDKSQTKTLGVGKIRGVKK